VVRTPDQELNDDIVTIISSADTDIIGYPTATGMIPYWAKVEKDNSASSNSGIEVRVNGWINRSKEDMNVYQNFVSIRSGERPGYF
jgi:hypothetical protein